MKNIKDNDKQIGIKAKPEEVAAIEWLAKETRRTRSGVLKWLAMEKAIEMGYIAGGEKKKK